MQKGLFCVSLFLGTISCWSQTLIINEFSNGPAGAEEYIEFVVVDDAVSYDCNASSPPCIDIRGWIIDDNSGYHGTGGIAPGCNRFSMDPFWSCIPLGTIITIYNNADRNADMPADDLTLSDGNCTLTLPINNVNFFDNNLTTPGDLACDYPTVGWVAGGNWNRISMANSGDCVRLVNLSGCEVFSLCYAGVNVNTLIYFNSGGSGTDNLWYFNDGDPFDQSNWLEGCADVGTCASNEQTPGAPNNALNAAYIAQFNNNCNPITPTLANITIDNNEICGCDGQATANGSGSIGGYTYEWFDASQNSIGQVSATATGLCAGTYHCVVTSSIGCTDEAEVDISAAAALNLIISDPSRVCAPAVIDLTSPIVTVGSDAGTLSYWQDANTTVPVASPSAVNETGIYFIRLSSGSCSTVKEVEVIISPEPNLVINDPELVCISQSVDITSNVSTAGSDLGNLTYWSDASATEDLLSPNEITVEGSYFIQLEIDGCTSIAPINVSFYSLPNLMITDPPAVCSPNSVDITNPNISIGSGPGVLSYWQDFQCTVVLSNPEAVGQNSVCYVKLEDVNGCTMIKDVNVIINPLSESDFSLAPNCNGAVVTDQAGNGGTFNFSSIPSDLAEIDTITGSITNATVNSSYEVQYQSNGPCPTFSIESVLVLPCLDNEYVHFLVPTAITPDGTPNKTWDIIGLDDLYPNNTVLIYNRWGNIIFKHESSAMNPYNNNKWDGRLNGEILPVSSYYFIIEFNDGKGSVETGSVSILRN